MIQRCRQPASRADDARCKRVLAVIECILNQNARDLGAASYMDMNWDVLDLCRTHQVGILQMPCPEMVCLGFERTRSPGASIRDVLDTEEGRRCCRSLSVHIADRLHEYHAQGFRVLAVLGGNPQSPGCAVHEGRHGLLPTSGVFMQELERELKGRALAVPFRGIRDHDAKLLGDDMQWLKQKLSEGLGKPFVPGQSCCGP